MKILKIFLLTALLTGLSSVLAQGQTSGGTAGDATITLIEITEVTKITDLLFGDIIPHGGGSVIINPDNGNRTATGGVGLMGTSFSVASFEVKGGAGQSFSFPSLPTTINLEDSQNNTMTVGAFVISPSSGVLGSNGKTTVAVGATLIVSANQPPGIYSNNTDLKITVSFQ